MARDKNIMWCNAGWFRGVFKFGFAPNEKAWTKGLKELGITEEYPTKPCASTFTFEGDDTGCIIVVTVRDGLEEIYSPLEISCLIFHEAVHVFQGLVEFIGEENPSPEFEAYSMQSIAQELIHCFEISRRPLALCGANLEDTDGPSN